MVVAMMTTAAKPAIIDPMRIHFLLLLTEDVGDIIPDLSVIISIVIPPIVCIVQIRSRLFIAHVINHHWH